MSANDDTTLDPQMLELLTPEERAAIAGDEVDPADKAALAAIIGAVGGWISGAGGLVAVMMAAVAALTWRSRRRAQLGSCEPGVSERQHGP